MHFSSTLFDHADHAFPISILSTKENSLRFSTVENTNLTFILSNSVRQDATGIFFKFLFKIRLRTFSGGGDFENKRNLIFLCFLAASDLYFYLL